MLRKVLLSAGTVLGLGVLAVAFASAGPPPRPPGRAVPVSGVRPVGSLPRMHKVGMTVFEGKLWPGRVKLVHERSPRRPPPPPPEGTEVRYTPGRAKTPPRMGRMFNDGLRPLLAQANRLAARGIC